MTDQVKRDWRDGPWYWAMVVSIVTTIAALVIYQIWVRQSLEELLTDRDIYNFGVVRLFCSPEQFWGQEISFKFKNDRYERAGILCRDWVHQKWIPKDK